MNDDHPFSSSSSRGGLPEDSGSPSEPEPQEEDMITQFAEPVTRQVERTTPSPSETRASQARVPELTHKLEKDLVQVFKLLADETRLKILFFLGREKELHVSAMCERLGQSQPAVSHHLALLRVAGLIEPRRDGKHNFYSIQQHRFHELMGELFQSFTEENNASEWRFEDFIFTQNRTEE